MKKKSKSQSARVLIALLVCGAACSIVTGTLLAYFRTETPARVSHPATAGLTFAERVSYQRAIEAVYWRHRIWPKERTDHKPSLDEVMSRAQLERKVADYLRNSQALEDYWQRPITAEQLQAEMERMATRTKQPEVLRELFETLGNDPFVIAECLARPALAERLLTTSYAYDERFHGELGQRAEADLRAHPSPRQMKQTSGKYREIELVRSDREGIVGQASRLPEEQSAGGVPAVQSQDSTTSLKLNRREWQESIEKLATQFDNPAPVARDRRARRINSDAPATDSWAQIKTGVLSSLQEDESRYYATAVVKQTKDRLKVATVEWPKEPLGSWRARAENQLPKVMAAVTPNYTLPTISDVANSCTDNSWTPTNDLPVSGPGHTAVWTGSEMIVWGGYDDTTFFGDLNTGGRYNPSTDSWAATSTANAPIARAGHTAVWDGREMIVWGGQDENYAFLNTGGRYDPSTDSWTATSTTNVAAGRTFHTAVWTGSEMIVWGGDDENYDEVNTGGRYNPDTDAWTATSIVNAPVVRAQHTAVWSGSEMIIWGGASGAFSTRTGGRYNPSTDSWTPTSTADAPSGRAFHTAVWSGTEMIVWGGENSVNTGGRYNPSTDGWTATSTVDAPSGRTRQNAVWTGSEMIIWCGDNQGFFFTTGGRYNPSNDSWTATSIINAPPANFGYTAVWTGTEMIVWDGSAGGRYNFSMDSWVGTGNPPTARGGHTAVWTGTEMIVWGGYDGSYKNTGGRYTPSTDSWTATTTANAPFGRQFHTAVWTGDEMIVWGGYDGTRYFNSGGRYNPDTDTWLPTSIGNAPTSRYHHTAVWTGREMIVWGGYDGINIRNTGGRYNPTTDSWIATDLSNAPSARQFHTAVWTGSEMIVWGGNGAAGTLNRGGKYDPDTDSWTATSTTNAPTARSQHAAVWTGFEMIVWGGLDTVSTGGRYNPSTDSWTATRTINAPGDRAFPTAVWTGREMIVWGGNGGCANFMCVTNTGGRYNPSTDSWTETSIANAPSERVFDTAVWTGNEMIVWGGNGFVASLNTGARYCAQPPNLMVRLGNISTRSFVQTGDNVMIGGFIVRGTQPKRVIVRAIGPELTRYGVPNPLLNPSLELHDGTGALIASNDTWTSTIIGGIITSNQVAQIRHSGHAPTDETESAIIADLPPGNYTAIVRGVDNMTGVALVEVYDLNAAANSILANISTRAFVQTGDNVMIGGFIVHGTQPKRVIIRAIGPELSTPPFRVPNALANPTLELHDSTGALIASNDNWQRTIIGGIITTSQVHDITNSGHAPSDPRESAIIAELPSGSYTVIVRGVSNTTGVALVEVYDLQ